MNADLTSTEFMHHWHGQTIGGYNALTYCTVVKGIKTLVFGGHTLEIVHKYLILITIVMAEMEVVWYGFGSVW